MDARVFLFLTPVLWGITFPAAKLALGPAGPLSAMGFMFWSRLLGALALVVTMPFVARADFTRTAIRRAFLPSLFLAAMIAGGYTFQTWGTQRTTATNAGLITGLYVVLTPLLLWLLFRTRITGVVWITVAISAAGLTLLSMPELGLSLPALGDLLIFVGTFGWAFHVIAVGRFTDHHSGAVLAVMQMALTAVLQFALLLAVSAGSGGGVALEGAEAASAWPLLLITGIVGSGIGYTFQVMAQREVSASRAAIVLAGESLVAAAASFLWLGERLRAHQLAGAVLIVAAMVLSETKARRPDAARLDPGSTP